MSHEMPLLFSELVGSAFSEDSAIGACRLFVYGAKMPKLQNVGGDRMATADGIGLSTYRAGTSVTAQQNKVSNHENCYPERAPNGNNRSLIT
jgi:hypothetical protein